MNIFGLKKPGNIETIDADLIEELEFLKNIRELLIEMIKIAEAYSQKWATGDVSELTHLFAEMEHLMSKEKVLIKRFKQKLTDYFEEIESLKVRKYHEYYYNLKIENIVSLKQALILPDEPLRFIFSYFEKGKDNLWRLNKDIQQFLQQLIKAAKIFELDIESIKKIEITWKKAIMEENLAEITEKSKAEARKKIINIFTEPDLYFHFTPQLVSAFDVLEHGVISTKFSIRAFKKRLFHGAQYWDPTYTYICFYSFDGFMKILKKALELTINNEGWKNSEYGKQGIIYAKDRGGRTSVGYEMYIEGLAGLKKSDMEMINSILPFMNLLELRRYEQFQEWIKEQEQDRKGTIKRFWRLGLIAYSGIGFVFKIDKMPTFSAGIHQSEDKVRYEVHFKNRIGPKYIIGMIMHPRGDYMKDIELIKKTCIKYALPLYDTEGNIIWPD